MKACLIKMELKMANYVIPAVGDDIQETTRGIQTALRMAINHGCELILLAPSIKAAKDSNMLESIFGEAVLNALAVKRETVMFNSVPVRIEALSTLKGAALRLFDGVILGLWTSKYDAIALAECKPNAKEIILIQWIQDELSKWAEYNNASYI